MTAESLAYFCPRVNLLKLYGPVIAEQRRRGLLRPLIVVPISPLITYAAKNRGLAAGPRIGQLREELGSDVEIVPVESTTRFLEVLDQRNVQAVVSVGLRLPADVGTAVRAPSRARGVRWCALGYILEELLHVLDDGPEILNGWDVATTFSSAVVDATARLLRESGRDADRLEALRPIGFVECDQAPALDRAALRARYGLPADRRIVCFGTAPRFESLRRHAGMPWLFAQRWYRGSRLATRWWRRRWPDLERLTGYRDIVDGLRRFADRHDALLIGKTRAKHGDPSYVAGAVDILYSDGTYYPFRTLELLTLADYYVGVSSSMAFEAAFVGRRMLTLVPFPPESFEDSRFFELKREFFYTSPGLWNAAGFSDVCHTYRADGWADFCEWAERGDFHGDIDTANRKAVVERVIGFDDDKASARFLDAIEIALGQTGRAR